MLNKQSLSVNFANGLDTKTDPKQVVAGKFLSLQNSIFTKAGLLQKRNGFKPLASILDSTSAYLTTFSEGLVAVGSSIESYSADTNTWVSKGSLTPSSLSTVSLIKNNTNQSYVDLAVASNNLACVVYIDQVPISGTLVDFYKYVIVDSISGQNIIPPTLLVGSGTTYQAPKVFVLGFNFIIVFSNSSNHLQYIAISTSNPEVVSVATDISTQYLPTSTGAFDGVVANNNLYLMYNATDLGGGVRFSFLNSTLGLGNPIVFSGFTASIASICADNSQAVPNLIGTFYDVGTGGLYVVGVSASLNTNFTPQLWASPVGCTSIASISKDGITKVFYEVNTSYGYDSGIPTHHIRKANFSSSGTLLDDTVMVRGVGIASKAFIASDIIYLLTTYDSENQSTYFLLNEDGNVVTKVAYSNGGGYLTQGLPNAVVLDNNVVKIPYLIKDLLLPVNKSIVGLSGSAVFAQTGINLAAITINENSFNSVESGKNLNLSGGILWAYDGYLPVEQEFNLWPDNVEVTTTTGSGSITAQQYFYQATYEWSDNQGNLFRSAPSIPVSITTSTTSSTNTIYIPTLRLTYKTENPVKIVLYRWSVAQQTYYQVTSILSPVLNDVTVDYVTITDTLADLSIVGNSIIYTTGGVLENIAPPATDTLALYDSRMFLVDAEDRNLLWFSKPVLQDTPVEFTDLQTIYVAPSLGAQGSTGVLSCLSAMDDKLILFKKDAIYYLNGRGPDITGANNQYSDPTFITSTVGCVNQKSIVFIPQGLLFQSDKGIWLLDRNLSTSYIGAPVEAFNADLVLSAINIPATNQVRFVLDSGVVLMYDYYFGQWGTFTNVPNISSTIYQGLHTYINDLSQVFQENPGRYLDNTSPVLMSFTTGWIHVAGIQGFQRFYDALLVGDSVSPFKLDVRFAFDYNPSPRQSTIVYPNVLSPKWGNLNQWGSGDLWGGNPKVFEARVFPTIQKCEAFQVTINEIYDTSYGTVAGAGLTLSSIDLVVGIKKGQRNNPASRNFG